MIDRGSTIQVGNQELFLIFIYSVVIISSSISQGIMGAATLDAILLFNAGVFALFALPHIFNDDGNMSGMGFEYASTCRLDALMCSSPTR